jgi:hypothetical protein
VKLAVLPLVARKLASSTAVSRAVLRSDNGDELASERYSSLLIAGKR